MRVPGQGEVSHGGSGAASRVGVERNDLHDGAECAPTPGIIWAVKLPPPASPAGTAGLWSDIAKESSMGHIGHDHRDHACRTWPGSPRSYRVGGSCRSLPANPMAAARLPLRGLALAALALAVFVPLATPASLAPQLFPFNRGSFFLCNVVFGIFIGLTMTPLIILRALSDRPRAPSAAKA